MNVTPSTPSTSSRSPDLQTGPVTQAVREDTFQMVDKNDLTRRYAKEGAVLGLKIGCGATIIGIPFATKLSESQGRGKKARVAKKQLRLCAILGFPSFIVGGLGAGLGAVIGAATGALKLTHRNRIARG